VTRGKGLECPPLLARSKVQAVWGIKGGVGKSTVSALVAKASSQKVNKVTLLVDTDFRDGSSRFFLGEEARRLEGWYDVLVKGGRLEKYLHRVEPNLYVVPSGTMDSAMKYSMMIAQKGVREVMKIVARTVSEIQEDFDLVVVDVPVTSFADVPILKCMIDSLRAKNTLVTQASAPEIRRTLKLVREAINLLPSLLVVNQIHPRVLADANERRALLSVILEIVEEGIKVIPIPFSGELYEHINWNSKTVEALEECMAYLLWGVGDPKWCNFATRGLYSPEIAKMVASISSPSA